MAISYLSRPIESNPYVLPVDLGLLSKVLEYKQNKFDQGAQAEQNQLSTLYNADIANPLQKKNLTDKVNNLTKQLNDMGGIDYSDMNIANTVSSYGTDIYNDPNVINGISSTAALRKRQAYYEKIKTDPKLAKFYNPTNEAYDSQWDIDYINGGIDAKYTGPTTPTLYTGNPFNKLNEAFKNIRPDIETGINPTTGNPYYFSKTENKYLSPDRAFALVQGSLDGQTMAQLKIDAWGNMNNMKDSDIEKIYTCNQTNRLSDYDAAITDAQSNYETEPTAAKKQYYSTRINDLQNQKQDETDNFSSNLSDFRKSLQDKNSRLNTITSLYTQNVVNNVVKANSYKQINNSLIQNVEQIQKDKFALEEFKAKLELLKEKKKKLGIVDDGDLINLDNNTQSSQELKGENLTDDIIKQSKVDTQVKISDKLRDFFVNNASGYQGEGYAGFAEKDQFTDQLAKIAMEDGNSNLSIGDVKQALAEGKLKDKAQTYFKNVVGLFDQASAGNYNALQNTDFSQSDLLDTYKTVSNLQQEQDAKEYVLDKANQYAINKNTATHGLTAKEQEIYSDFVKNKDQYITDNVTNARIGKGGTLHGNISIINNDAKGQQAFNVLKKVGLANTKRYNGVDVQSFNKDDYADQHTKYVNEYLSGDEFRKNYYTKYLNDKDYKDNSEVRSFLADKGGLAGSGDGNSIDQETVQVKNITQIPHTSDEYTKNGNTWAVTFGYKEGKGKNSVEGVKTVAINDDQALAKFGVASNPYSDLDNVLLYKTKTLPTYGVVPIDNSNWGSPVFKYYLSKPGKGDPVKVVLYTDDKNTVSMRNFNFNNKKTSFENAAQAMSVMDELIKNAGVYPTREDFLNAIQKYQNL